MPKGVVALSLRSHLGERKQGSSETYEFTYRSLEGFRQLGHLSVFEREDQGSRFVFSLRGVCNQLVELTSEVSVAMLRFRSFWAMYASTAGRSALDCFFSKEETHQ